MKKQLAYIELKTGYSDNGPAWIGLVEFSKSGQTIYFDDKALKKQKISGNNSNHYDIETGNEYWVSGVKKNGQDRHWAGKGKIMIDKNSIEDYLLFTNKKELNSTKFQIIEFKKTDKERISKIENAVLTDEEWNENTRQYWDKGSKKFEI
jgi:hypothetical protein